MTVSPGPTLIDSLNKPIFLPSLMKSGLGYLPGGHLPPPKFGHLPPPNSDISHPQKKTFARRTTATPNFFSFFGALFLAFSTYSSWRTSRMGRRRCLMRCSWSTSSRRCVTRWSWSTYFPAGMNQGLAALLSMPPVFSFEFLGDTNTYGNCNGWMGQQFRTFS